MHTRIIVLVACLAVAVGGCSVGSDPPTSAPADHGIARSDDQAANLSRASAAEGGSVSLRGIEASTSPSATAPGLALAQPPKPAAVITPTVAPKPKTKPQPIVTRPARTVAPKPAPKPTAASHLKIVRFGTSLTPSKLLSAIANNSIDVIELRAGTYRWRSVKVNIVRTRRVVIRPVSGATVVFAGGTNTAFEFGYNGGAAANITMQGFIFSGYHIGATGIIWIGNARNITVNRMTVRASTGIGGTSWALYLSTDGGHGPSNIVANDWRVDGGGRTIGALQIYHDPSARGVTVLRWHVTNCAYTIYAHSSATGLRIENWTASHCGKTTYAYLSVILEDVRGTIKNFHSTHSGRAQIGSTVKSLGGNYFK